MARDDYGWKVSIIRQRRLKGMDGLNRSRDRSGARSCALKFAVYRSTAGFKKNESANPGDDESAVR
jgi:hypothetical protein